MTRRTQGSRPGLILFGAFGASAPTTEARRPKTEVRNRSSRTIVAQDEQEPKETEVSESELIRVRREKLARIVELGFDAFPTTADVDTTVLDLVAAYGAKSHDELEAETPHV